ncbi:pentapeptide repeat-containing protein [Streptomyces sp. NTH33]|uniref:pentapeptide repeat-containing protein n=1 Tax=Streptomyces sp. NTH33 TaxID=1735453 RepID=UPI0021AC9CB4|nr:pentapeptide repeat-containing protein [Streptomyces sp. NTH33]
MGTIPAGAGVHRQSQFETDADEDRGPGAQDPWAEGLADDAPTRVLRQTCIDVLCAYLRLPCTAEADLPAGGTEARHAYLALREVRHTVVRLIRDHLRLPSEHPHSWQGHDFYFTGATFDGGVFSGAVFSGGSVSFASARFSGRVPFNSARFSGSYVDFSSALIDGTVSFDHAEFSGSTVSFDRTKFSGDAVSFGGAEFGGGTVDLRRASGVAPSGLVPLSGPPLPTGLLLPPEWHPTAS